MPKVVYESDGRIGRVTLNRPAVMNAIDADLPSELEACVDEANADPSVHVIVLSGAGDAFCAGYDLTAYAQGTSEKSQYDKGPWDPMQDYAFMMGNTQKFMSLWRSYKPVIAKVHGFAVAGGSDIALCCDLVLMAESAKIGYMPARVWGCPTTAMWVYRLGAEQAKRMLLTGDKIDGTEAQRIGLIHKAVPDEELDAETELLAERMCTVPTNQLMMQKLMINQALDSMGLQNTQMIATLFDGMTRHSPEGVAFKKRSEAMGWKQAVRERDLGTYDWTMDRPINSSK